MEGSMARLRDLTIVLMAVLIAGCGKTRSTDASAPPKMVADVIEGAGTAPPHTSGCVSGGFHSAAAEIKIVATPPTQLIHLHRGTCVVLGAVAAEAAGELRFAATGDDYALVLENPTDATVPYSFRIDYFRLL